MNTRANISTRKALFKSRIYFIFSVVAFYCLSVNLNFAQEIGAYKTISSGDFGDISIWEFFDGLSWSAAIAKPNQTNDVYIDQGDSIRLTENEQIKSLFINADSEANQKLNLNSYNLDIYWTLQAFKGLAPGTPSGTIASINWIGNSLSSTLTFKGISRVIIPDGAWSALSIRSRYSVIFNPEPDAELTVERAFKSLQFTIRSGTVIQQTDNSDKCSTFSFNNETILSGSGPFGNFLIESGGKLVTYCSSDILFRSGTNSAALFQIDAGGELVVLGENPRIEAAAFQLQGKVIFAKESGTQNFFSKKNSDSVLPTRFHHLEIQGSQNIIIPDSLSISGDITQTGTGAFDFTNTSLNLFGSKNQHISGFSLNTKDLTLKKNGGIVQFSQNLTVMDSLKMIGGSMDFQGNELTINTSGFGGLHYTGGSWNKLPVFNYKNSPTNMDTLNATFPFADQYHLGIRKVQMLGDSNGGDLSVHYTEYQGVDTNPDFADTDSTPILYRLFSYFQFYGLNSSVDSLMLKISAQNLIVDDPDHLRVVGTGYAAPGKHIPGTDSINLWAVRRLRFDDLKGSNFTIGSVLDPSILPIVWLETSATWEGNTAKVIWTTTENNLHDSYEVYRFQKLDKELKLVGEIKVTASNEEIQSFTFRDHSANSTTHSFYQIKKIRENGSYTWSEAFRLEGNPPQGNSNFKVFPNPSYGTEEVKILLPPRLIYREIEVHIYDHLGRQNSAFIYSPDTFSSEMRKLQAGIYLIRIYSAESNTTIRWIKK